MEGAGSVNEPTNRNECILFAEQLGALNLSLFILQAKIDNKVSAEVQHGCSKLYNLPKPLYFNVMNSSVSRYTMLRTNGRPARTEKSLCAVWTAGSLNVSNG